MRNGGCSTSKIWEGGSAAVVGEDLGLLSAEGMEDEGGHCKARGCPHCSR